MTWATLLVHLFGYLIWTLVIWFIFRVLRTKDDRVSQQWLDAHSSNRRVQDLLKRGY